MPKKRLARNSLQGITQDLVGPDLGQQVLGQVKELVAALRFLSVLPIPGGAQLFAIEEDAEVEDAEVEDAEVEDVENMPEERTTKFIIGSAYFPLVGLLIALLLVAILLVSSPFLPPLVLAGLLMIAQVVLTGGLHMDGLMDSSDGLFGGTTPERRLEIMKDSRVGSFAVLAAGCVLIFKFAVFASLRVHLLAQTFLMVLPAARWAMVLTVSLFPSARAGGLGAAFRQTVNIPRLLVAAVTALIVVLVVGRLAGLLVLFVGSLAVVATGAWVTRRIGGLTGDSYGAIEEVAEISMLLLIVVLNAWF